VSANQHAIAITGSNSMNLAKIIVDPHRDLGVVMMTNFPGDIVEKTLE
jgi:hypothetical protein